MLVGVIMASELVTADPSEMLGFYVAVRDGQFADLEIVASAAISWAQSIKAAAAVIYPQETIRVSLIAAEPGSSRWLARIEQSNVNKLAEEAKTKWQKVPAIIQFTIGLAVAWPTTIVPAIDYYGQQIWEVARALGLDDQEIADATVKADTARSNPSVEAPQKQVFKTLQRDPNITGVASGIPIGKGWKPPLIPASQFAEADGLFSNPEPEPFERTLPLTLDVFLVTPQLVKEPKTWRFRQEGLPPFGAVMRDKVFLAALDRNEIRESMRTNIPMKIKIEVRQRLIDGEWTDVQRTRAVVEVISPKVRQ